MSDKRLYPKGKLYTCNVAGMYKVDFPAELLLITRAGYEVSNAEIIRDLSPTPDLFHTYLNEWKDREKYETWWPKYEKRFLEELKLDSRIKALREVYKKLVLGKDVVLLCYCNDHRYCHRKLVGEFFNQFGVEAIELNPIKTEQLSIF